MWAYLGSLSADAGDSSVDGLAPMEIAAAFLPPMLFEELQIFTDIDENEVGVFFSLYETATLFPIADVPDTVTEVGSPIVGASVVAMDVQQTFTDLPEPVVITVRLNEVLGQVGCTHT